MVKKTIDKHHCNDDVRYREFETTYGNIRINTCKSLDMIVVQKEFKSSGIVHHIQLTTEEFNELKKIEV